MNPPDRSHPQSQDERFGRLLDVGATLLSELDLESVLRSVVDAARELTAAEYAALGVLDRDRTELERFIYLGIDDETKRAIGNLPRGRGVLGELIREPVPLRLRDVNEHPHAYGFPPGHPPMHTFLGVPITVRGETYGNLYMTRSEREAEVEQALRRAETSVDIARAVGGETDVDRVLELIVKRARALVEARTLLVLLRRGEHLVVVAQAGEIGEEVGHLTIPTDDAVFQAAMQERVAQHLERGSPPSEVRLRERLGAEVALVVPLLFRGHAVGVLVALDREAGGTEFDAEDLRLLQAFASSAAMAVATAQSVECEGQQQQVEIGERERQRWAQELHDDALQGLAAIRISLATALQGEGAGRAEQIEKAAGETVERLEEQINELSRLINDLRPASLERLGLVGALEALAEETSARGDFDVETEIEIEIDEMLNTEEERVVYRLVQEALNNVLKTASAGRANAAARLTDHQVQVVVRDDGCGFDPGSAAAGRGLVGMRERIELLGGEIEVRSEPESGTQIAAQLPVQLG